MIPLNTVIRSHAILKVIILLQVMVRYYQYVSTIEEFGDFENCISGLEFSDPENTVEGETTQSQNSSCYGASKNYDGASNWHYYYRARHYDPTTGRFLQNDPLGYVDSMNLYQGMNMNPWNFLDPFGLEKILGIHSNVRPEAGFTDGHAWITIYDTDTKQKEAYGLWPDSHVNTIDNKVGTDVRKNMELSWSPGIARYYRLTNKQEKRLIEFLAKIDHWSYWHTCADWARDLINYVVGVSLDVDDWVGFETPRELSETIVDLEKERKTSIDNPQEIVDGESSGSSKK